MRSFEATAPPGAAHALGRGARAWPLKPAAKAGERYTELRMEMISRKIFHLSTAVVGMLALFFSVPLTAQYNSPKPIVNHAVASGISAPLRDLAKLPARPQYGFHEANPVRRIPRRPAASLVDRVEQHSSAVPVNYSIGIDVLGLGNGFPNYTIGFAPPDTNRSEERRVG